MSGDRARRKRKPKGQRTMTETTTTKALRDVKPGEYFKRKPDARAVFVRGAYDRSSKRISATDFDDICRELLLRPETPVFVGFTF